MTNSGLILILGLMILFTLGGALILKYFPKKP